MHALPSLKTGWTLRDRVTRIEIKIAIYAAAGALLGGAAVDLVLEAPLGGHHEVPHPRPEGRRRRAPGRRRPLAKLVPALVKRFHKVTVDEAPPAPSRRRCRPRSTATSCAPASSSSAAGAIANEPQIHYAQERPMERLKTPAQLKTLPRSADCSEFATDAYAYAGAPDPNGMPTSTAPATPARCSATAGTSRRRTRSRATSSSSAPAPATTSSCSSRTGTANGGDPLVCSHGQEKGPLAIYGSPEESPPAVPDHVPVLHRLKGPHVKTIALKAWHGFLAGITSTDAVKAEKSLAVLVAVRVLVAVGASAALVQLVEKLAS
jgi:hypothetical protein